MFQRYCFVGVDPSIYFSDWLTDSIIRRYLLHFTEHQWPEVVKCTLLLGLGYIECRGISLLSLNSVVDLRNILIHGDLLSFFSRYRRHETTNGERPSVAFRLRIPSRRKAFGGRNPARKYQTKAISAPVAEERAPKLPDWAIFSILRGFLLAFDELDWPIIIKILLFLGLQFLDFLGAELYKIDSNELKSLALEFGLKSLSKTEEVNAYFHVIGGKFELQTLRGKKVVEHSQRKSNFESNESMKKRKDNSSPYLKSQIMGYMKDINGKIFTPKLRSVQKDFPIQWISPSWIPDWKRMNVPIEKINLRRTQPVYLFDGPRRQRKIRPLPIYPQWWGNREPKPLTKGKLSGNGIEDPSPSDMNLIEAINRNAKAFEYATKRLQSQLNSTKTDSRLPKKPILSIKTQKARLDSVPVVEKNSLMKGSETKLKRSIKKSVPLLSKKRHIKSVDSSQQRSSIKEETKSKRKVESMNLTTKSDFYLRDIALQNSVRESPTVDQKSHLKTPRFGETSPDCLNRHESRIPIPTKKQDAFTKNTSISSIDSQHTKTADRLSSNSSEWTNESINKQLTSKLAKAHYAKTQPTDPHHVKSESAIVQLIKLQQNKTEVSTESSSDESIEFVDKQKDEVEWIKSLRQQKRKSSLNEYLASPSILDLIKLEIGKQKILMDDDLNSDASMSYKDNGHLDVLRKGSGHRVLFGSDYYMSEKERPIKKLSIRRKEPPLHLGAHIY